MAGKENAKLALSLVEYDNELKNAMKYVFGSTFVCQTREAAVKFAFNNEGNVDIREPHVTLEGDMFQPSGLLTGGGRRGGGELLRQIGDLAENESNLSTHQNRLSEIDVEIPELLPLRKKFAGLNNQLKLRNMSSNYYKAVLNKMSTRNLGNC